MSSVNFWRFLNVFWMYHGHPEVGRSSPHQPAPVAGADKHRRRRSSSSSDLRPRVCRALFTICISCDRGQRYCSPECRSEVRRRQRHDANCRYQQSDLERDSHRRCQQRYRERVSQPPVTDQGILPITSPAPPQRTTVCQCAICGRHSLWIDPFPSVPRRFQSAGR